MNVVDEALFEMLEAAGMWVPALHEEDEDAAPVNPDAMLVHDGLVVADNTSNVVEYELPYAVYYSSLGDDPPSEQNERLTGRRGRRSIFWSVTYVGADRNQAKWAGQKVRDALSGRRVVVAGHRSWLITVEESQRVRRDDDAIRPDGSPLFYGVDNYSVSITLTPLEEVSP
ncbi:MAG: hypothetical protein ABWX71_02505 [Aeromicrobium sp.]